MYYEKVLNISSVFCKALIIGRINKALPLDTKGRTFYYALVVSCLQITRKKRAPAYFVENL